MLILTFDTTLEKTYLTLVKTQNSRVVEFLSNKKIENKDGKFHSAFLIQEIKNTLEENSLKLKDLSAIGINIGPGSFTGIRVSLTAARVIAQALNLKVIGVNCLEILSQIDNSVSCAVITDARRDEAYFYDKQTKEIKLIKQEEIKNVIENYQTIICDNETEKLINVNKINYLQNDFPLGKYLAELCAKKIENEDWAWAKAKPLYIQSAPIHQKA